MAEIVVVTGASKPTGIGYEVCRQLATQGMNVVLTARDAEAAGSRARELGVRGEPLDVTDPASIERLRGVLEREYGRVDVLVNNAAGMSTFGEQASTADLGAARDVLEVTLFGAWRLTQALLPLLRAGTNPRIVNVSSGAGSHGDTMFGLGSNNQMGPGYSIAKAALNALTSLWARELGGMRVNAVCPGFTATFPGGEQMGARPVADGAASVVWAATLPPDGPSGGLFRDGAPLPW